jgi:HlyD family secretion protein
MVGGVGGAVVILLAVLAVRNAGDRSIEVRAETVEARDLTSVITATGSVRPRRQVNISSDVVGRVVELNVEEGDEVERGMLLLRIDPSTADAQVSQARANLVQAERDLDRLLTLRDRDPNLVSRQALEEAETRVAVQQSTLQSAEFGAAQARASLEVSEDQRARTTIIAPMSGRVTRLNIEEGETVVVGTMNNPGSLLLTISDLSVIEAVMSVDETDVPRISVGDTARVELDAFSGQRFTGVVSRIGNSAIQATGGQTRATVDFEVVLTLVDPPTALRPDLSASADIVVDRRNGAVAVPIISVTIRDEPEDRTEGVFLVREGRAVWTPVEIGITGEEHFEILSGVQPGDVVVSGPYQVIQGLEDGRTVTARSREGSGGSSTPPSS